jgi:hypothetical protein
MKRGIIGTFHHGSVGHLHRYCDEFAFRYSRRGTTDGERAESIVARKVSGSPTKQPTRALEG